MISDEIEKQVIQAFLVPKCRARYAGGFGRGKKRFKALDRLNHCLDDFDERFSTQVPSRVQTAAEIEAMLVSKGAPGDCYIISSSDELDGETMALQDALEAVVGMTFGTVISCIHGQLAYVEGEDWKERFILERSAR